MTPALDVLREYLDKPFVGVEVTEVDDDGERKAWVSTLRDPVAGRAALADLEALVQAAQAMLDWERDPTTGEPPDGAGRALAAALSRVLGDQ